MAKASRDRRLLLGVSAAGPTAEGRRDDDEHDHGDQRDRDKDAAEYVHRAPERRRRFLHGRVRSIV